MPKGFEKGNKLGGRTKGSKNKETLLKEERRAIFDKRISQKWEQTIDKLRPEYVSDQFMGPAPQEIKTTLKIEKMEEIQKATQNILKK